MAAGTAAQPHGRAGRHLVVPVVMLGAALLVAVPAVLAAQEPTVVILVRHAEKAAEPANDPPLTPAGEARAAALAAALREARVSGIVSTQFRRTLETAAPLARGLGLTPDTVRAGGQSAAQHAQAVAAHVRDRYAGRTVLVVGHSNTIPPIIAALGGPRMPDLCDPEYAHLFVLVLRADGTASLVDSTVGAADPPSAPDCRRTTRQGP